MTLIIHCPSIHAVPCELYHVAGGEGRTGLTGTGFLRLVYVPGLFVCLPHGRSGHRAIGRGERRRTIAHRHQMTFIALFWTYAASYKDSYCSLLAIGGCSPAVRGTEQHPGRPRPVATPSGCAWTPRQM